PVSFKITPNSATALTARRPPSSPLFPYTTLFRSGVEATGANIERVAGFRDELKKYPGLKIVADQSAAFDRKKGHDDLQTRVFLEDRKSTRLNSSHGSNSYAVFCLKKNTKRTRTLT